MREKVSAERVEKFMKAIGRAGKKHARIYFVGGATAVLLGWRETTIDVDVSYPRPTKYFGPCQI
jgi:hypothetical protein